MAELDPEDVVARLPPHHAVLLIGGSGRSDPRYFNLGGPNELPLTATTAIHSYDDDTPPNSILKKYVSGVQKIQRICKCAAIDTQHNKVFFFKHITRANEAVCPSYILIFKTTTEAHQFYTDYVADFPKVVQMKNMLHA